MSDETSTQFGAFLAALRTFRATMLKEGIDFDVIPGTGNKPTLLKPGSEKIAKWLGLRFHFEADQDTWAMAGSVPGLLCYLCYLIDGAGEIVGEGRGSAHIDEGKAKFSRRRQEAGEEPQPWPVNSAIKFAAKRAQVDAILRYGCLSQEFTQDLEDQEADAAAAYAAQAARAAATAAPPAPAADDPPPVSPADFDAVAPARIRDLQLKQIRALLADLGLQETEVCKEAGVARLEDLSAGRADAGLKKLQAAARRKGAASA